MSTIEDVKNAISELNERYPRPGFTISVSGIYDIRTSFSEMYPNAPSPGVYIMLSAEGVVLRIGKASCGSTLGVRLTAYFGWEDKSAGRGRAKEDFYRAVCFIATIAVPKDRAFEAEVGSG